MHLGDIRLILEVKHTGCDQTVNQLGSGWMLTLANGLSNMLFYLELWTDVPPDFHYPSSFKLLIS